MTIRIARRLWPAALVAGLAVAALALWLAAPSPAVDQRANPRECGNCGLAPLGLVGLTEGQTLRISIAHVKGFDPQPDPPGRCLLEVGFAAADGSVIGDPEQLELPSGLGRSFDLPAARAGIGPGERASVRPVVVDLRPDEQCPAVVTGEVLDREGITGYIIHWMPVLQPWATTK